MDGSLPLRPDHRRSADINLLDALVRRCTRRHRLSEGVEVANHEVERLDVEFLQLLYMLALAPVGENAGVNFGVQGLDSPFQALGKASEVFDFGDRNSGIGNAGSR